MTNSDTTFGVHNKQTVILSQIDDGSTALTTFSNTTEAKSHFFTDDALTVIDECSTQLQWGLVNDGNGDATQLKRTFAFGIKEDASTEQWAEAYNRRMKALQDADGWGKVSYTTTASDSHLF